MWEANRASVFFNSQLRKWKRSEADGSRWHIVVPPGILFFQLRREPLKIYPRCSEWYFPEALKPVHLVSENRSTSVVRLAVNNPHLNYIGLLSEYGSMYRAFIQAVNYCKTDLDGNSIFPNLRLVCSRHTDISKLLPGPVLQRVYIKASRSVTPCDVSEVYKCLEDGGEVAISCNDSKVLRKCLGQFSDTRFVCTLNYPHYKEVSPGVYVTRFMRLPNLKPNFRLPA